MSTVILIAGLSLIILLLSIALWRARRTNAAPREAAPREAAPRETARPKVRPKRHRSVSSAALLMSDARRLPRFVDVGDDLDMTVISAGPVETGRDGSPAVSELEGARRSRVDLVYEDEAEIDEPTAPAARILMSAQGNTDCGRFRAHNEDNLLMLRECSVFVVADGMGGHHGGEVASELAVKTLDDAYSRRKFQGLVESERPIPRRAHDLALAIQLANQAVYARASSDPKLSGMGTTLVAARFSPRKQRVYIGHIGDSRCYRIRQGSIRQLTKDHTMASIGVGGPHGQRLVRAVGIGSTVTIDLIVDKPRPNDVYLLCSDGLPKMVQDEELLDLVLQKPDLDEAVNALIELANDRGGKDNVTVILVRVVEHVERQVSAASG
jgi:serine/threonine protein phosphatase PrpC